MFTYSTDRVKRFDEEHHVYRVTYEVKTERGRISGDIEFDMSEKENFAHAVSDVLDELENDSDVEEITLLKARLDISTEKKVETKKSFEGDRLAPADGGPPIL